MLSLLILIAVTGLAMGQSDAPGRQPAQRGAGVLLAAGGEDHLWVVRSKPEGRFTLLHRRGDEPQEGKIFRLFETEGRPVAVAARGAVLYIAYTDGSVQSIRYRNGSRGRVNNPYQQQQEYPLPPGGEVIDLRVTERGPVALMRFESADDPSDGDGTGEGSADEAAGEASGVAASEAGGAGQVGSSSDSAEAEGSAAGEGGALRLLAMQRGRWQEVSLPEGLDAGSVVTMTSLGPESTGLALLSREGTGGGASLRMHRYDGQGWSAQGYELAWSRGSQAVGLRGDVFILKPGGRNEAGEPVLDLWWLRKGNVSRLGRLGPIQAGVGWQAVTLGGEEVGVVAGGEEGALAWTRRGVDRADPAPPAVESLQVEAPQPLGTDPFAMLVVAAVVVAMLLVLLAGRRDPQANTPSLPEGVHPAGLNRAAAAVIDFAPAVAVSMLIFGISNPTELVTRWPGSPASEVAWQDALPAAVTILIHAAHTTVSELLFAATLGKALLGCRVTDLTGGRPRPWQVLLRGGFKILELAAPLLLILPLLSPFHQRFGDLVGRTVVINGRRLPSASPSKEDED